MRRPLRSWSNLLGKLGLRVVDKPANHSRQRLSQRRLAVESLEGRSMMAITSDYNANLNTLLISSDTASDTVAVGTVFDNGINAYAVTINGNTVTSGGSAVAAASLQHLIVNGNEGDDTLDLSAVSSTHFNSALEIVIDGGAGADTIKGSQLADRIIGGTGNDSLTGNGGNDTYVFDPAVGNLGTDTIIEAGGTGVDTLDFSAFTTAITVDLSVTSSQTISSGTLTLQLSNNTGLENVIGGSGNDTITGNIRDNVLIGGAGDDTLSGGTANDTLLGQAGNDSLSGGSGNDTLDGGTGDDSLSGDGGNDTYRFNVADGDLGTDTVTEAADADTDTLDLSSFTTDITIDLGLTFSQTILSGGLVLALSSSTGVENVKTGSGNDTLIGNSRNNVLTGNGGNDSFEGKAGNDTLVGGIGNDTYKFDPSIGNLGSDTITEGAQSDTDTLDFSSFASGIAIVLGLSATQTVRPGTLDLALSSGAGMENVLGGSGDDTITGNGRVNVLLGGNGNDTLGGGTANDTLLGQAGNDTLTGGTGNDTLDGGTGDDSLSGDSGSDTFLFNAADGNLGTDNITEAANLDTDTLDFSSFTTAVTIDLSSISGQAVSSGVFDLTISSGTGIENVIGGSGNDTLTGNTRDNTLTGGAGDDSLLGGAGNDTYKFDPAVGNLGTDTLTEAANSGSDTLDFSPFTTDVVVNLGSTATQTISSGVLSLRLSSTNFENATGGSGNDTLTGSSANNILIGNAGNDTLLGLGANDKLSGGAGNDSLQGGTGIDTYYFSGSTSLGSDTIVEDDNGVSDTIDLVGLGISAILDLSSTSTQVVNLLWSLTLSSAIGIENLYGTNYADALTGNSLVNIISGNGGNDIIDGGEGDDQLDGGAGNDTIYGGTGDDKLIGGGGDDLLAGGIGDDLYWYSGTSEMGSDIVDEKIGEGNDSVNLSHADGTAALNVDVGTPQVLATNLTIQVKGGDGLEYATPSKDGESKDDIYTVTGEPGTEVTVLFTYVSSIASYKNMVYVYEVGQDEPADLTDEDFINLVKNSEYLLFTSNFDAERTTVPRTYPVGTKLSFFIVQNGGELGNDAQRFYTFPLRNPGDKDHVETTDFGSGSRVYNWEDLSSVQSNPNNQIYDGDFNDVVFSVKKDEFNLSIYDGQFGAIVPDNEEESVGAYTLANLNDTDGDKILDYGDDYIAVPVPPGGSSYLSTEIDASRTILKFPDVTEFRVGDKIRIIPNSLIIGNEGLGYVDGTIISIDKLNKTIKLNTPVPANYQRNPEIQYFGVDEVDLMKLTISKPLNMLNTEVITLNIPSNTKVWLNSYKENQYLDNNGIIQLPKNFVDSFQGDSIILWIEVVSVSQSLRDIEIVASFRDKSDRVRATGMWSTVTAKYQTESAQQVFSGEGWSDVQTQDPTFYNRVLSRGGTGLLPPSLVAGVATNGIAFQFDILPHSPIGYPNKVVIDTARIADGAAWTRNPDGNGYTAWNPIVEKRPELLSDRPNDDEIEDDETSLLGNRFLYSYDRPGWAGYVNNNGLVQDFGKQAQYKSNFKEFARMSFSGTDISNNFLVGSRSSDFFLWRSQSYAVYNPNVPVYERWIAGGFNLINIDNFANLSPDSTD